MVKHTFTIYWCSHCEIFKIFFHHFLVLSIKLLRPISYLLYGEILPVKLVKNVSKIKNQAKLIPLVTSLSSKRQPLLCTRIRIWSSKLDLTISAMSGRLALSSLIEKYFIRTVATNNKQIEKIQNRFERPNLKCYDV